MGRLLAGGHGQWVRWWALGTRCCEHAPSGYGLLCLPYLTPAAPPPGCPQGRVSWLSNDLVNMAQISLAAGLAMGMANALGLQA